MTTRPLRPSASTSATTAAQAVSSAKSLTATSAPALGERERDAATDAPAGAGDERGRAGKVQSYSERCHASSR